MQLYSDEKSVAKVVAKEQRNKAQPCHCYKLRKLFSLVCCYLATEWLQIKFSVRAEAKDFICSHLSLIKFQLQILSNSYRKCGSYFKRSVANTAAELIWVCSLLTELGVTLTTTPTVYCDNVGATYLSANPVFHSKMKHLALDFHFVRNNVQSSALRVTHVSTKDQFTDALAKPLPRTRFNGLIKKIGVTKL